MKQAIEMIKNGQATCVVARGGEIIHSASGLGVKPLLDLSRGNADLLRGADVYDKVIGKGAAAIVVLHGAVNVYGEIMSKPAVSFLLSQGITPKYGTLVEIIKNRTGDDICPIEKSVLDVNDPAECYNNVVATVNRLMGR